MSIANRREAWARWLGAERLVDRGGVPSEGRSPFDRDHDRVVFSDAFRRLADKTQVWPLAEHDHTRTRLTHSLEVSCVGRSLGTLVGKHLAEEALLPAGLQAADVGTVVATACLAHDIGNPPFGHSGESSMQACFTRLLDVPDRHGLTPAEAADLSAFEGNAQGFRILTRLTYRRVGGMRPTYASLGAMVKYPRGSLWHEAKPAKPYRKFGFFQHDLDMAREAFGAFGPALDTPHPGWPRHPLAWLSEAADDICYMIIDLEDAVALGVVPPAEARGLLGAFVHDMRPDADLGALRAQAIHALTMATLEAFRARQEEIEAHRLTRPLIAGTPLAPAYDALKEFSAERIYQHERVLEVECAGHQAIEGLLGLFAPAILAADDTRDAHRRRLVNLIPPTWFDVAFPHEAPPQSPVQARAWHLTRLSPYERLLVVTDWISSMTDSLAVDLYQKLTGVKLPRR